MIQNLTGDKYITMGSAENRVAKVKWYKLKIKLNSLAKAARLGLRLLKISVSNPQRLSHVLGSALAASDEVVDSSCDVLRLPQVQLNDLLPEAGDPWTIKLDLFPRSYASISLLETLGLLLLLKRAKAGNVFEFGTYKGISITQFALNLPFESRIFTLDLPEGTNETQLDLTDADDARIAQQDGKGSLVPQDLRPRITFIKQDSACLDVSTYSGKMDFIFVDGAHNYDYVKNDSDKGWQMLRRGGIMAWHDCRHQDPDVVRFLLESPYKPSLLLGTSVAFAQKP